MVFGIDKLRRGTNVLDTADILRWKITLATATCSIATGPKPVANLLDMVIFVTVTRMALEDHWQPKVFGESARPLLESAQNSEAEIWLIAGGVLRPEQQTELRRAIEVWYAGNPLPESVTAARALGFASQVAEADKAAAAKPGSVFSLLGVDPLAGMDPAVRELAQTRMLAERALFLTQKMPTLLRWQTELLTLNATATPAMQQVISNSTRISDSMERFAAVAEKLPNQVSTEREEILRALQAQEKDVTSLLSSGTQMSASLNTTLMTFEALMKRFGVGETNMAGPPPTNAEPFRIQDYTQTAAQLEATARQLTELLVTLDRTLGSSNLLQLTAQVGPVVQQAQSSGKEIVDYAFWKGILLVTVMLAAALIYRFLVVRLIRPENNKINPP
jgi:cytochrome c556